MVVCAGKDSSIVLSPTRSNNVNGPLNWARRRKPIQMVCVLICAFSNPSAAVLAVYMALSIPVVLMILYP